MKPVVSPSLILLFCAAFGLDALAQATQPGPAPSALDLLSQPAPLAPSAPAPTAPTLTPASSAPALAPAVAPPAASAPAAPTAPAVPAVPAATAPAPASTPAALPASSALTGRFAFDDRFTSFTEETMPPMVRFKYRIWPYTAVTKTDVQANGQALAADADFKALPYSALPFNETALLILVDTSLGSSRQPRTATIDITKRVIAEIVNQTLPRTKVGLYTFSNDLVELAPVGSPPDRIKDAFNKLKADGRGTRLYRRAMDAIEKLSSVDAQRKAILIFSDGKDEDTGYTRENLQEAAEKAGVIVMALGCPETEQDVPALGALEWLADRTKGLYAQLPVAIGGRLPQFPAAFPRDVLESLDGGGDISVQNVPPGASIAVKLTTQGGQVLEKSFQLAAPPVAPTPTPDLSASPTPSPASAPPQLTFWEKIGAFLMAREHRVWVILGGIVLLLVGIGLLFLLFKLLKSSPPPPPPMPVMPMEDSSYAETTLLGMGAGGAAQGAALAYLVVQDANATKMPLNKTATRIGRRSDNDLVFSNTSISGHHAEIHMSREGAFSITDLGSGNGVFVNGERIHQCGLRDGDIIELGEVRFRFSL